MYFTLCLLVFSLFLIHGCGGGGFGNIDPVNPPNNNPATQTDILGTTGYVYTRSVSGLEASQGSGQQIFIYPNNHPPGNLGLVPLPGAVVNSLIDGSIKTMTDSNGYFTLPQLFNNTGDLSPDIFVNPGNNATPISYPILYGSKPSSDIIPGSFRIVPPYDETATGWSMKPGQIEWFIVIGKDLFGNWYVVSDTINWSVTDTGLGTFVAGYGIFQAAQNPSVPSGQISATFGNMTIALNITVSSTQGFGTISGQVQDQNGNPAVYAIVEVNGAYSTGITDLNGNYSVQVPNGTYEVRARTLYGNTSNWQNVTVLNNNQTVNLTLTTSGTYIPSFVNGMVQSEELSYNAGDTINTKVTIINLSNQPMDLTYGSILFELIEKTNVGIISFDATTVDQATTGGGHVLIDGYGSVQLPSDWVQLTAPLILNGYYYLKATVKSATGEVLMTFESPVMIGVGGYYPYPTPGPGPYPTPVPGQSNDYYRLVEIGYKLNDLYYELSYKAERAYAGENVSAEVETGSFFRYDLLYVRNGMLPYLETIDYTNWQADIDDIIEDLDAYIYAPSGYSNIYNALYRLETLKNEIQNAKYNLPASEYRF